MLITKIIMIALLLAFTAFFVITEFAIIKVRPSRLDQLIAEGNKNALAAKKVTSSLDEYLSACQLGITITSLGLGWLGESTIERILEPVLHYLPIPDSAILLISFALALAIMTYLHVVIGELTPKTFAIYKAEAVSLAVARPITIFYRITYPFIKILNGSAQVIARLFGLKAGSEHNAALSEEELRIILTESYEKGAINQSEYKYVDRIFDFDNRLAKEIMVPRTEICTIQASASWDEILNLVQKERYTRYPVVDGDKDSIIGVVHLKDLIAIAIRPDRSKVTVIDILHPIISVIEMIPIHDLLLKMQKEQAHMALLFDEYGGTSGIVTAEDIIEEIVGEIRDEFDSDEIPDIRKIGDYHYIVDSKVLLDTVNDLLNTHLEEEGIDTIGGWILAKKYDVQTGDNISDSGFTFTVKEMEGHHISYLEIKLESENQNGQK